MVDDLERKNGKVLLHPLKIARKLEPDLVVGRIPCAAPAACCSGAADVAQGAQDADCVARARVDDVFVRAGLVGEVDDDLVEGGSVHLPFEDGGALLGALDDAADDREGPVDLLVIADCGNEDCRPVLFLHLAGDAEKSAAVLVDSVVQVVQIII